ncbi:GrpB family protein [Amycolatopsis sp. NPDC059090]|uniref:GrpB family protein n=1 Tax=unclassified Amycolatopsis TaxID=2618356 RepID=UPI00366D79F5
MPFDARWRRDASKGRLEWIFQSRWWTRPALVSGICWLLRPRHRSVAVDSRSVLEHVGSTAVPGLAAKPIIDLTV